MFKISTTACLLTSLMPAAIAAQTCHPESIPATTPVSRFVVHGDGTVMDTRTQLMWKQCAEGQSGADCGNGSVLGYTWQDALEQAQTVNQEGGFAGHTDWRVPNIKEMTSIVERQCYDPAVNLAVFPNALSNRYWSSSPVVGNPGYAWFVDFNLGYSTYYYYSDGDYAVRLVRGGQDNDADTRLAIGQTYQNGIIFYLDSTGKHGLISAPTDQSTGMSWYDGSAACSDLVIGAYTDWYLPSQEELRLMRENIGQKAAAPLTNIGNFAPKIYWSSTETSSYAAASRDFGNGRNYYTAKSSAKYVRCIHPF